jgi:hypothetical protein
MQRISQFCTEYAPDFEELLERGSVLNEYITEGRYPGDITFESIGETEAQEAVSIARCIRGTVIAKLPIDDDTDDHPKSEL